ncbi:hypothetical protein J2X04_002208 [Lysobacter niabensis]|uniref:Uncharacterized protein n=1 Tax=Agrilutibacter niabensis TaxID=380628 RepID=A0ABU1VQU4_9GAMM|nr:hypothetical protein [Lysobacter niabensis]MDR7099827.1 hypothetical protein [Lysobacter niabensis]
MEEAGLSYTELDRRIRALPDGPAKVLDTPRWLLIPNAFGTLGMVLAKQGSECIFENGSLPPFLQRLALHRDQVARARAICVCLPA